MNKVIAIAVALSAATTAALANGNVNFANGSSVGNGLVTGSGAAGSPFDTSNIHSADYVAQLFYSVDGNSFTALGTPSAFKNVTASSVRAGVWGSSTLTFGNDVNVSDTASQNVTLKVAVWDSTKFATWADAAAEIASLAPIAGKLAVGDWFQAGITGPIAFTVPKTSDLSASDFNIANFNGLQLTGYQVTPEPSVVALGALGLGALLWRRRK